ncbi:hypothetical protein QE152_g20718 [Popillia japonica]|uniref:Uncharacterized protein n=1 Tax=Popillia japonica TaxID=7064 RepID=A0AAW1KPI8_POPJA
MGQGSTRKAEIDIVHKKTGRNSTKNIIKNCRKCVCFKKKKATTSEENEVENEQLDATSETSPDQESVNGKSSVSSEDVEEAFISRGKVTSSGRVTKPPQRLDL